MNAPITPQSLLQQIAQIQHMERGKLCVLREGPPGPYYNHQTWENGRNVSRYVPQDQVPALQQAIAGYERFQNLTDQYAQIIIQQTRADLAAGLKKKTPRPKSSWPKTKKSNG
jgi:hypothetical protein